MPKSKIIVDEFINSLGNNFPIKLAYNSFNRSLFFFAVIDDNDHEAEKNIILTEARLNAKFSNQGYSVSASIVGKDEEVEIPDYFKILAPQFTSDENI